jgi:hypothetical protein
MSLETKINEGIVNKVSAGEVCSIETAKKLGIFDNTNYYLPQYDTMKTYNDKIDNLENRTNFKLCTVNNLNTNAFPLCTLTPNAGIGFTTKSGYNKCIASECPPGFEEDENNPTICKKPIQYRTYSLKDRNDERWYDWFTVPNYHLGNKFGSSNNIHYKPCKPDMVPNYAKDIVDNVAKDWSSVDEIDRCINKNTYFAGKYANTADYCPAAYVKLMGSSRQELVNQYLKLANTENLSQSQLREILAIEKVIKSNNTENLDFPTDEMTAACSKINTNERLEETYQTCQQLMDNENVFMSKFTNESESLRNLRRDITKYNCHNLFCATDTNENNAARIDKDSLCYPDIAKLKIADTIRQYQEEQRKKNKNLPSITSNKEKKELMNNIKTLFFRMLGFLVIAIIIFLIYKYGGKVFKRIYHPLMCKLLNLFKREKERCKTWEEISNEELAEEGLDTLKRQKREAEAKKELENPM